MENETAAKTYALVENAANEKLIAQLETGGARVVRFPPLEIERIALDEKATAFFNDLTAFDWLIFTDVFAADFFLETLEEDGRDSFELDDLRICALGEAVSDRLRFARVHADVVPVSVETNAVVAALVSYIGENEIAGKRFLVVKKYSSAAEVENVLKATGAEIIELEIYRAEISARASGDNARLKALLSGGAIDEFVFAAPADFFALEEFFKTERLPLSEILRDAKICATDQVTVQFLRERAVKAAPFRRK